MTRFKNILLLLMLAIAASPVAAQHIIEYTSGYGSRTPDDASIWILYRGVQAAHEGMTLTADSAHYNTRQNSFTAFGNVVIHLTDTTTLYGDRLYYDGNTRIVDIWADTVLLVDGSTTLRANHLTYDRNRSTAFYTLWGHAVSDDRTLDSREGQYNSDLKQFYIYGDVHLLDSTMLLLTDTLLYNTATHIAHFESYTRIFSDSSVIYSRLGDYNTDTRYAISYRASHVSNSAHSITSDTLYYDSNRRFGRAFGNVVIIDSANDLSCTGRHGETNLSQRYSFVTDSAKVLFVESGDSLFLHADTIYVVTDTADRLSSVRASHHVKAFRRDAQAMCDSAFYSAADSLLRLFQSPVLWYDHYQCSADTIVLRHDSSGILRADLFSSCFALQQVDLNKFNQLVGRNGVVHFSNGEPTYADILGNARMVFYITEENSDGQQSLVGVNAGVGSDMRIYFDSTRAPVRVVTYDNPDMQTYPVRSLPDELKRLPGFNWQPERRPRRPEDIFVW